MNGRNFTSAIDGAYFRDNFFFWGGGGGDLFQNFKVCYKRPDMNP